MDPLLRAFADVGKTLLRHYRGFQTSFDDKAMNFPGGLVGFFYNVGYEINRGLQISDNSRAAITARVVADAAIPTGIAIAVAASMPGVIIPSFLTYCIARGLGTKTHTLMHLDPN